MKINMLKIQDNISKKHKDFISSFGSIVDVVLADQRLFEEMVLAKLKFILQIFVKQGIIDSISVKEDSAFKSIELTKKPSMNKLYIVIGGDSDKNMFVIIKGATRAMSEELIMTGDKKIFKNILSDDFDWEKFSDVLLEYIHKVIYEQKLAVDVRIKNSLIKG